MKTIIVGVPPRHMMSDIVSHTAASLAWGPFDQIMTLHKDDLSTVESLERVRDSLVIQQRIYGHMAVAIMDESPAPIEPTLFQPAIMERDPPPTKPRNRHERRAHERRK